jgi:hypothetical protein
VVSRIAVAVIVVFLGLRSDAALACVGDCNGDGIVSINELIVGVNIALLSQPISACGAFDCQGNGTVPINCLIQGVNSALDSCQAIVTPTVGTPIAATPTVAPTAPPTVAPTTVPTVTLSGSCAAPGSGSHGLKPCDAGTPITVLRCDDPSQCLHQQGLTMVGATTVADSGGWSVQVPMADASASLIFQASITKAVVYRTLRFGSVGSSLRAGLARDVTFAPADITPVTEAAVQLLDSNGFANYSDTGAQQVVTVVEQATATRSFDGDTPEMGAAIALEKASADPMVMMVLQTARNTPTPTQTVQPTPTATPPGARFVDDGDGTIKDHQMGLRWEKKDQGGGLHDANTVYVWAGICSDNSGYCQPDDAAATTCNAATGGAVGCAQCAGTATCNTFGFSTIWQWLNQLNAARFAGESDWRIQNVGRDGGTAKLETIVDLSV